LPPVQTKFFCFESEAWKKVVREVIVLTHVFRQSDNAFVALLNDLRLFTPHPSPLSPHLALVLGGLAVVGASHPM
jgi:hypothetical protein